MQAPEILSQASEVKLPPAIKNPRGPEAEDPEQEYEARLAEAVVWEEYFADKGVF